MQLVMGEQCKNLVFGGRYFYFALVEKQYIKNREKQGSTHLSTKHMEQNSLLCICVKLVAPKMLPVMHVPVVC